MTPEQDIAYNRALDWMYESLNERGHLGKGLGDSARRHPTWTRALLDALGAPDADIPSLLVVGSKGKGSTSSLAAAALGALGRPVGLSTSPHLVDVRERVRLDLRAIDAVALTERLEALRPVADALRRRMPSPAYQSPVGLMAVVGAVHFAAMGAAYAVYEAGRGGLVDDVAEVAHQVVATTPILLEHRQELGPGLPDIARHKAGAIRPGTRVVVTGALVPAAAAAMAHRARAVGAERLRLGREVRAVRLATLADGRERVRIETPYGVHRALDVPYAGPHQADNLAVAVTAAEALAGRRLPTEALAQSLSRVRWPGRLETLRLPGGGAVLLDGAIEPAAVARALDHAHAFLPAPYAVVIGAGTDKRPLELWNTAAAPGHWTVVTRAHAPHLHFPANAEAESWAAEDRSRRASMPELSDALREARERATTTGTVVVVGTLSLIGEALHLLGEDAADLIRPS